MNNHTAKHFVLQLGSLISLYLSLAFFLVLSFGFINLLFPDSLDSLWQMESAAGSIRIGFAMVVVFFPTYLVLTRMVNQNRRQSKDNAYLGLTKWLIYLSLLVGGLVLLGDMVAIIIGFLEGELTMRYILKAVAVFAVTGAAFYYYIKDAQGYWLKREKQSLIYATAATIVIIATLIAAVVQIPNPAMVREMKVDNEVVSALQNIHWQIQDYYQQNQSLPENIDAAYGEFDRQPTFPETASYTYSVESDTTYKLCTTFNHDSNQLDHEYYPRMMGENVVDWRNNNWDFKAGEWCFERVVEETNQQ